MSYGMTRYRSSVGDVWSELWNRNVPQSELDKACPQSSAIKTMKDIASDLEATWKPTGFYTWNQMADIVASTALLSSHASSVAVSFFSQSSTPSAKDKVRAAADRYNQIAKQALDYTEAWRQGKAANRPIEAPGLKQWVIDDLRAAADLMRTIELEVCGAPWWLGAVTTAARFTIEVANVTKRIAGVAVNIAGSAIKAVERAGGIAAFLVRWAPYIALGVGGVLVYRHMKQQ